MKKIVLIILLAIILLGSLTTLTLYNIGGFVLDGAIDNALITKETDLTVTDQNGKQEPLPDADQNANQQGTADDVSDSTNNTQTSNTEAKNTDANSTDTNNSSKSQVMEQPNVPLYTEKQVEELKADISAKDKIAVSTMVLSKLSSTDIQYLTGLLADGLTEAEKAAAKKLCYERFSKKDIETIYSFYKKYVTP